MLYLAFYFIFRAMTIAHTLPGFRTRYAAERQRRANPLWLARLFRIDEWHHGAEKT
jgi:hypothetical protein